MLDIHRKKMIVPIVIAGILVMYYIAIAVVFVLLPDIALVVKLLLALIPLVLAGVALAVTVERICEIRSGEEDDIGQY